MIYQGSKSRLKKYILPIIQNYIDTYGITKYIEPFVGGANLIDGVQCENRIGSDVNPYLISLLQYVQSDPKILIAPDECSKEHYSEVRDCYNARSNRFNKEYVALIGYSASYGGRFFDGGYGRDASGGRSIYGERIRNLREQAPKLKGIQFSCKDYKDYNPNRYKNCLFLCDPPYRNTKKYAGKSFNHEEYYDWCRELAKNNIVIMCEYDMPDDFECIWQKERKVLQKSNRQTGDVATEKLFLMSNILVNNTKND